MSTVAAIQAADARRYSAAQIETRSWRSWLILFAIILLPLLPFLDHWSSTPQFGPYSYSYVVFLACLPFSALTATYVLALIVSRTPTRLQFMLAISIVLLAALTIGAIEVGLGLRGSDAFARYRQWGHARSQLMGFEAAPSNRWQIAGATYTTDENGFRTHLRSRPPRDRERLIVVMGESSAFGFGLNDDETWPHLLEGLLRERVDENITVLNAANNGHNSLQQLIRYYTRVQPLKPEVVIYYGAMNDVRIGSSDEPWIHMPVELLESVSERDYLRITHKDAGFYFRNSLLLHHLKSHFESMISRATGGKSQVAEPEATTANAQTSEPGAQATGGTSTHVSPFADAAHQFVQNLKTMRLICEANDTRMVTVSFLADVDQLPRPYRDGLPQLVGALRGKAERDGSNFVDLQPTLENVQDVRTLFAKDHYHPSHEGAKFIAEQLAKFFR